MQFIKPVAVMDLGQLPKFAKHETVVGSVIDTLRTRDILWSYSPSLHLILLLFQKKPSWPQVIHVKVNPWQLSVANQPDWQGLRSKDYCSLRVAVPSPEDKRKGTLYISKAQAREKALGMRLHQWKYFKSLHATETGISSGLMGHLASVKTWVLVQGFCRRP